MRETEFFDWLINVDGRDIRQTRDNVSRARRVENSLSMYLKRSVNLDDEYSKDKCSSILEMLSFEYSPRIPEAINLPRNKNGLSSLRTAIKKYIKFCGSTRT
ncbi:hypothetical protein [Schinkia azotoformans]|uniref:hypothetical protein n=1 Tax=Schinkia azotoformans TaxID=1454 RepID=UPI002DBD6D18|nr:hypothetical protein [Schinkia azotoformans]MEC1771939.1 hypothetical protein [Schinkia azotoformans]MED4366437.1 hypothetical protein [Schinkia azotoformans]